MEYLITESIEVREITATDPDDAVGKVIEYYEMTPEEFWSERTIRNLVEECAGSDLAL